MKKSSTAIKQSDIKREWHLIDLKGKVLGRISVDIAKLLMGKSKPNYVRNLDCGDYVVVINAKEIKVTGKKETDKKYYRHSGYPGGFREETLKELREKRPEDIIIHAVSGMVPQNKLKAKMLKRFRVFAGPVHGFEDKFKNKE
ncbi:MAG: 50S ribosomal protein L13 [Candidatus Levyibacteriota bacterium]